MAKNDLPPLEPGKCAAIVESDRHEDGARHFSMQRVIIYGSRRCSRKATDQVVHLACCTTHARMAREGLVAEDGTVADKGSLRDVRKFPEKFKGGLSIGSWATRKPKIEESRIHADALAQMRARAREGTRWAAYENKALDSANAGHLQFLMVGTDCTYSDGPEKYPQDNEHGMGWRYLFAGHVNLETGAVES